MAAVPVPASERISRLRPPTISTELATRTDHQDSRDHAADGSAKTGSSGFGTPPSSSSKAAGGPALPSLPPSPGTPVTARNSPLTPQMLTKEPVARSVDPGLAGVIRLSREERLLAEMAEGHVLAKSKEEAARKELKRAQERAAARLEQIEANNIQKMEEELAESARVMARCVQRRFMT